MKRTMRWIQAATVAVVAAAAVVAFQTNSTKLTIDFSDTQGLYAGNEVRVLGVKVGEIDSIEPRGTSVRVRVSVDRDVRLPKDASAVIVAPSLVGGRYVQLAPAYRSGEKLSDGDHIPLSRTAVPVKWDDIKRELGRLSDALGESRDGERAALSQLVHGTSRAVDGQGASFARTVNEVSKAAEVLAVGSPDLLTTIRNLNGFVNSLNRSDDEMVVFARQLRAVSDVLEENERQLRELLSSVSSTVGALKTFTTQNRQDLRLAVDRVTQLASDLDKLKVDLANILHLTPTAVANLYNIYDPTSVAFTGRPVLGYTGAMSNILCQAIYSAGGSLADCRRALDLVLDQFDLSDVPIGVRGPQQGGTTNQVEP